MDGHNRPPFIILRKVDRIKNLQLYSHSPCYIQSGGCSAQIISPYFSLFDHFGNRLFQPLRSFFFTQPVKHKMEKWVAFFIIIYSIHSIDLIILFIKTSPILNIIPKALLYKKYFFTFLSKRPT